MWFAEDFVFQAEDGIRVYDVTGVQTCALPIWNLSDFSVVILANVRELSPDYELELENFVLNGGALLFGMGDQVNPKYINERLGNLLPVKLDSQYQAKEGEPPLHLLLKNNTHPVMKIFSPKELEEIREINFYSMYTIQAREIGRAHVWTPVTS